MFKHMLRTAELTCLTNDLSIFWWIQIISRSFTEKRTFLNRHLGEMNWQFFVIENYMCKGCFREFLTRPSKSTHRSRNCGISNVVHLGFARALLNIVFVFLFIINIKETTLQRDFPPLVFGHVMRVR